MKTLNEQPLCPVDIIAIKDYNRVEYLYLLDSLKGPY